MLSTWSTHRTLSLWQALWLTIGKESQQCRTVLWKSIRLRCSSRCLWVVGYASANSLPAACDGRQVSVSPVPAIAYDCHGAVSDSRHQASFWLVSAGVGQGTVPCPWCFCWHSNHAGLAEPGLIWWELMVSMRCYFTAIFTLSLPILATTMVPCLAENETLPSIDFAVPRAFPSRA